MDQGERYRGIVESGANTGADAALISQRANRRLLGRSQMTGSNPIPRIITPHERVNAIGVLSRRRRVSPGLAPSLPTDTPYQGRGSINARNRLRQRRNTRPRP